VEQNSSDVVGERGKYMLADRSTHFNEYKAIRKLLIEANNSYVARLEVAAKDVKSPNFEDPNFDPQFEFDVLIYDIVGKEIADLFVVNFHAWHAAIRSGAVAFEPEHIDFPDRLKFEGKEIPFGSIRLMLQGIIYNNHPAFFVNSPAEPGERRLPPSPPEPEMPVEQVFAKNPVPFKILHVDGADEPTVWIDRTCARAASDRRDIQVLRAKSAEQAENVLAENTIGLVICHWVGPHREPEHTVLRDMCAKYRTVPVLILPYEPFNPSPAQSSEWQNALNRTLIRPGIRIVEMKGGISRQIIEAINDFMAKEVRTGFATVSNIALPVGAQSPTTHAERPEMAPSVSPLPPFMRVVK
jgi:hypothetical protein